MRSRIIYCSRQFINVNKTTMTSRGAAKLLQKARWGSCQSFDVVGVSHALGRTRGAYRFPWYF